MKTQTTIEALLAPYYTSHTDAILAMGEDALKKALDALLDEVWSPEVGDAMEGIQKLLDLHKTLPKSTVRINLTKRPLHA